MNNHKCLITALGLLSLMLGGCVSTAIRSEAELSTYRSHMPKSILVLPPINDTPEVRATYGYWSTVALPIAEAGYYVFPMPLVDNIFKENGVINGNDAQSIAPQKLQEIFGADAGLYIRIKDYGSKYQVIQSTSTVHVEAKLVDLKSGTLLWSGEKVLSQANGGGDGGSLIAAMVIAAVQQISSSIKDNAHLLSNQVSNVLYRPNLQNTGLLHGPRSPQYQQQTAGTR